MRIRGWIAEHLEADIHLVDHHRELDGYLGRAHWSVHRDRPLIQIARYITRQEISNSVCALGMRGDMLMALLSSRTMHARLSQQVRHHCFFSTLSYMKSPMHCTNG